jgi:hypothetical protein
MPTLYKGPYRVILHHVGDTLPYEGPHETDAHPGRRENGESGISRTRST